MVGLELKAINNLYRMSVNSCLYVIKKFSHTHTCTSHFKVEVNFIRDPQNKAPCHCTQTQTDITGFLSYHDFNK